MTSVWRRIADHLVVECYDIRHRGVRHWVAWVLVRIAFRVKDTTYQQVVRFPGGSAVMIEGDDWGGGVTSTFRVLSDGDEVDERNREWPVMREFSDDEEAARWMHETPVEELAEFLGFTLPESEEK